MKADVGETAKVLRALEEIGKREKEAKTENVKGLSYQMLCLAVRHEF